LKNKLDLALHGFNLLNNRDTVSAQFMNNRYRQRGVEVLGELTYRF
jgi:hypothetical protein